MMILKRTEDSVAGRKENKSSENSKTIAGKKKKDNSAIEREDYTMNRKTVIGKASSEVPDQKGKEVGTKQSLDALMFYGVWHVLSHLTDQSSWHEATSHPNLFIFQRTGGPPFQYHCVLA